MIDIIAAIIALDPATQVSVNGDNVTWHDGNPHGITAQQITAKQAELQAEYDAQEYARKRRVAYAEKIPVGDQLDSLLRWAKSMKEDSGVDLPSDLDEILVSWLTVKAEIPKI